MAGLFSAGLELQASTSSHLPFSSHPRPNRLQNGRHASSQPRGTHRAPLKHAIDTVLQQQARSRGTLLVSAAIKKSTNVNVVCSKTLVAKEGQEQRVLEMCQSVTEFSKQRKSDRAAGILSFDFSQVSYPPPPPSPPHMHAVQPHHINPKYQLNASPTTW
jgi:hypothetical protein